MLKNKLYSDYTFLSGSGSRVEQLSQTFWYTHYQLINNLRVLLKFEVLNNWEKKVSSFSRVS